MQNLGVTLDSCHVAPKRAGDLLPPFWEEFETRFLWRPSQKAETTVHFNPFPASLLRADLLASWGLKFPRAARCLNILICEVSRQSPFADLFEALPGVHQEATEKTQGGRHCCECKVGALILGVQRTKPRSWHWGKKPACPPCTRPADRTKGRPANPRPGTEEPGPLLSHVVEQIAEGAGGPARVHTPFSQPASEAPAKSLTSHGNALQEEVKLGRLEVSGPAAETAGSISNASRAYRRAVTKFAFALRIPSSQFLHTENSTSVLFPWLKPVEILTVLMTDFPELLLGGFDPGEDAGNLLLTFWQAYQKVHPGHELFASANAERLSRTVPVLLHGDGGRTQKKQPIEIVSLEAALGLSSYQRKRSSCVCCPPAKRARSEFMGKLEVQQLNHKLHSYLSRFLVFAYPSKQYGAKFPGLLNAFLKEAAENLSLACQQGVSSPTGTYYFSCVGFKADMEFHAKSGVLKRSYMNVGTANNIPCCHECMAGAPGVPFEDFRDKAGWQATKYQSVPWAGAPPFTSLEFESWDSGPAARFFRRDPFHVFRLGVARNYLASIILELINEEFFSNPGDPDNSLKHLLGIAWNHFKLWAEAEGCVPSIRSFTPDKLHCAGFPWMGCKGSDTILIFRWLRFFFAAAASEPKRCLKSHYAENNASRCHRRA